MQVKFVLITTASISRESKVIQILGSNLYFALHSRQPEAEGYGREDWMRLDAHDMRIYIPSQNTPS